MKSRGFVFSLDAFVAFTLIAIVIGLLVFMIDVPQPFYTSLTQAHQLAYDTLNVLSTSSNGTAQDTYLEQILGDSECQRAAIMEQIAGGVAGGYQPIIPVGYGYTLKEYDLDTDTWNVLFDSNDTNLCPGSHFTLSKICESTGRCGKVYTKLQASASTFVSIYSVPPQPGQSPYCYLSCMGYNYTNVATDTPVYEPHGQCTTVPCDMPTSNFVSGNNSIEIIELVVYT